MGAKLRLPLRLLLRACLSLACLQAGVAERVGDVKARWSRGDLEIHQISTGRGNAAFFIFPDGTTMLVDAGYVGPSGPHAVPLRPDGSRTPAEWIVRYVRRMHPTRDARLDYALLTHFHGDHMGTVLPKSPLSKSGKHKLSGITEVGEHIPIRTMLDRSWPDYDRSDALSNYRAFLDWQAQIRGMRTLRFRPGLDDQIVLVNRPGDYPGFKIRNVAANGEIWTGEGTGVHSRFPPPDKVPQSQLPTENALSIAFRLTYGKFDYFNGGDMPGVPAQGQPAWHDIETPVARAVGPVDVAVVNHHGVRDTSNAMFVGTLRPRAWILPVWSSVHGNAGVLGRLLSSELYPGPRDVFATDRHEDERHFSPYAAAMKSVNGHIVIRVAPPGDTYTVLILDNTTESGRVVGVHGPYRSMLRRADTPAKTGAPESGSRKRNSLR